MTRNRELCCLNSAGRADVRAGTAVLAFGGIDHIQTVDLGDRAFRTFGFAGTALDAIIGNDVRHVDNPFPQALAGIEMEPMYKG